MASTNHHALLITIDGLAAYYLSDSKAPIPTVRRLAREGAVAEGMRVSNPAITWPNHTTLITGVHPEKHSVLFNGVLTRPGPGRPVRVDPQRDKADLVAVPTLFDHLHQAGYRTAEINIDNIDVAPTLAKLLGRELPGADGKVLKDLLTGFDESGRVVNPLRP